MRTNNKYNKYTKLVRRLRQDNRLFDGTQSEQLQIERMIKKCVVITGNLRDIDTGSLDGCIICITD